VAPLSPSPLHNEERNQIQSFPRRQKVVSGRRDLSQAPEAIPFCTLAEVRSSEDFRIWISGLVLAEGRGKRLCQRRQPPRGEAENSVGRRPPVPAEQSDTVPQSQSSVFSSLEILFKGCEQI
jgi:hypothetical protein